MHRDPTAFKDRFEQWKNGKMPYEAGLPKYEDGKRGMKLNSKQQAMVKYIYNVLTDAGLDHYAIAGILGNAMQESSLDPDSVNAYGYRGLFQNSKAIQKAMGSIYGDHSVNSQLNYVIDWINGNKNIRSNEHGPVLGTYSGRYRKTGYTSAEEAGRDFMRMYERPVILDPKTKKVIGYQDENRRLAYSAQMLDYLNNTFGTKSTYGKSQFVRALEENPVPQYTPPVVKPASNITYDEYTTTPLAPQSISRHTSAQSPSYIIPLPDVAALYEQFWGDTPLTKPTIE